MGWGKLNPVKAAKKVGKAVGKGAKGVAKGVGKAGKAVGKAAGKGGKAVGGAGGAIGRGIGKGAKSVAKSGVGRVAGNLGESVYDMGRGTVGTVTNLAEGDFKGAGKSLFNAASGAVGFGSAGILDPSETRDGVKKGAKFIGEQAKNLANNLGGLGGMGGGGMGGGGPLNIDPRAYMLASANRNIANQDIMNLQGNIPNVQAAQAQMGADPRNMGQREQSIQLLSDAAMGQMPSRAEQMLQEQTDQAIGAYKAQLLGDPNMNPALAQKMAGQNAAQMQAQAGRQMGQLRADEMAQARGQLAGAVQGFQGQDLQRAGQEQQLNLANMQATNQMGQFNAGNVMQAHQLAEEMRNRGFGQDLAESQGMREFESTKLQKYMADQNAAASAAAGKRQMLGASISGLATLGAAAFSDQTLKEDIKKGDGEISEFLDALNAYKFKYKNKDIGDGDYTGFMAQDAEKSRVGKEMVIDTPIGKAIDTKRALMTALASAAHLNKRIKKLEKR
jgi:hypothetical protein